MKHKIYRVKPHDQLLHDKIALARRGDASVRFTPAEFLMILLEKRLPPRKEELFPADEPDARYRPGAHTPPTRQRILRMQWLQEECGYKGAGINFRFSTSPGQMLSRPMRQKIAGLCYFTTPEPAVNHPMPDCGAMPASQAAAMEAFWSQKAFRWEDTQKVAFTGTPQPDTPATAATHKGEDTCLPAVAPNTEPQPASSCTLAELVRASRRIAASLNTGRGSP